MGKAKDFKDITPKPKPPRKGPQHNSGDIVGAPIKVTFGSSFASNSVFSSTPPPNPSPTHEAHPPPPHNHPTSPEYANSAGATGQSSNFAGQPPITPTTSTPSHTTTSFDGLTYQKSTITTGNMVTRKRQYRLATRFATCPPKPKSTPEIASPLGQKRKHDAVPSSTSKSKASGSQVDQPLSKKSTKSKSSTKKLNNPPSGPNKEKPQTVLPTRYADPFVLSTLGMVSDFEWLCTQLGITKLMTTHWPTYVELTLSFLEKFACQITRGVLCEEGHITFTIFGVDYALTLEEFASIYGLSFEGPRNTLPSFQENSFWGRLTTHESFNVHIDRSTSIIHPCLRYFMRVLANTIFARGELDNSQRIDELFVLWSAYNHPSACIAAFLAKQFKSIATSKPRIIRIGGLITPIAEHLRIPLDGLRIAPGTNTLKLGTCVAMQIIHETTSGYCVQYDQDHVFPVPYSEEYSIRDPANWKRPYDYIASILTGPTEETARTEVDPIDVPATLYTSSIEAGPSAPPSPVEPPSTDVLGQLLATQHHMQSELATHSDILVELQSQLQTLTHMVATLLSRTAPAGLPDPPAQ